MTICIKDLEIFTIIGILEHERKIQQSLLINAKIKYKGEILDYADLAKNLSAYIKKCEFDYLETALDSCIKFLKTTYPNILKIKLRLSKPAAVPNCLVSVKEKRSF